MTRKLPWKRAPPMQTPSKRTSASPSVPPRSDDDNASARMLTWSTTTTTLPTPSGGDHNRKRPRTSLLSRTDRSPSTSPPPGPGPPTENCMIDGLDNDDQYRMVEDELLTVANQFTAHLHAAEYNRLKSLAKAQNEETIRNISRPVVGNMTDLVERRHSAASRLIKQQKGIRKAFPKSKNEAAESEDDDANTPWMGTSLHGLMESPRKKAKLLNAVIPTTSGTQATFSSSGHGASSSLPLSVDFRNKPELRQGAKAVTWPDERRVSVNAAAPAEEVDVTDDDLDTPVPSAQNADKSRRSRAGLRFRHESTIVKVSLRKMRTDWTKPPHSSITTAQQASAHSEKEKHGDDELDDDFLITRIKQRQVQEQPRHKREQLQTKGHDAVRDNNGESIDAMPTFLFNKQGRL